jgi:hypothetical protein
LVSTYPANERATPKVELATGKPTGKEIILSLHHIQKSVQGVIQYYTENPDNVQVHIKLGGDGAAKEQLQELVAWVERHSAAPYPSKLAWKSSKRMVVRFLYCAGLGLVDSLAQRFPSKKSGGNGCRNVK